MFSESRTFSPCERASPSISRAEVLPCVRLEDDLGEITTGHCRSSLEQSIDDLLKVFVREQCMLHFISKELANRA